MNSSGIRLHLLNIHTRRHMWILNLTEAGFWTVFFSRCRPQSRALQNVRNDEVVNRWCLCFPLPSNFLRIQDSRKDMEGSMKLSVKNTSKCCIAKTRKENKGKDSAWKNVKECECEILSSLVDSFFHPECGTHRTAPDRNEKSLAPRKVVKTQSATESFQSSRSRVVAEAPRHRSRLLKVSDLKKTRGVTAFFMWTNIVERAPKKNDVLKLVVPKIYRINNNNINNINNLETRFALCIFLLSNREVLGSQLDISGKNWASQFTWRAERRTATNSSVLGICLHLFLS